MPRQEAVLVIGDVAVDIIVPYPKFNNKERTQVEYPVPELVGGGTCANTAVALSRLAVATEFMGTVGDDQYGRYIQNDFTSEKVGTKHLIVDASRNTVGVFAFIDEYGERYLWGWPRYDQAFRVMDASKIDMDAVLQARFVHSSGMAIVHNDTARHTITEVFRKAHEAGIPTSFDLNLRVNNNQLEEEYRQAVLEIIKYSTYVLGSGDDEFYYLDEQEDWMQTAKSFVTPERTIVVRMGREGSIGISHTEMVSEGAFAVQAEDTVGAGDAYNAGFIAALLRGLPLQDCLRMGNAVAGYTVMGKGARCSPTLAQVKTFLQQHEIDKRLYHAL